MNYPSAYDYPNHLFKDKARCNLVEFFPGIYAYYSKFYLSSGRFIVADDIGLDLGFKGSYLELIAHDKSVFDSILNKYCDSFRNCKLSVPCFSVIGYGVDDTIIWKLKHIDGNPLKLEDSVTKAI
jgi:hypothetical protein